MHTEIQTNTCDDLGYNNYTAIFESHWFSIAGNEMRRADSFPSHELDGIHYRIGRIFPFGASIVPHGVNFSIFSKDAYSCELLLYHTGHEKPFIRIPFPEEFRIGDVYAMTVFDLDIEDIEYGFSFDGPYDPKRGLLFNKNNILLDPYAKSITGRTIWGQVDKGHEEFVHRGRIIYEDFDWRGDIPLDTPLSDLIIYEMHVRGFTKDPSSNSKYPGTFAGILDKIPYLKKLGINAVELLPIFEFDELDAQKTVDGHRLLNYWGYSTVGFYAPKAGYAHSGPFGMETDELKNLIRQLHQNGIEVILDVVFNHTAEGNENGPYISYRGIDNRIWYMLTPDGCYYNYSGCGNTVNCNHSVVRNSILDCLRYWVSDYHIDGFRFDLASILSRDQSGSPMTDPPLLETLAHDVVLGRTKLIAEAWDAGGLYQVGSFPSWGKWAEWNGKYRDCIRRFIKGDGSTASEVYTRIAGSPDLYANRSAAASINFLTCHDGFTMYDLVSYNEKHNQENAEDNRDGSNDNQSWNCGIEGDTDNPEIMDLRLRQIKNIFSILLLSKGIPMLLAGDEFANTQYGNNNAYCQDNEISWLDWSQLEKHQDLFQFCQTLIAFRKKHPVLRSPSYDSEKNPTGYPEQSFHSENPWSLDFSKNNLVFAVLYAESAEKYHLMKDCFIYLAVNAHWEAHEYSLPIIPKNMHWHCAADSSGKARQSIQNNRLTVGPRSIVLLSTSKDDLSLLDS